MSSSSIGGSPMLSKSLLESLLGKIEESDDAEVSGEEGDQQPEPSLPLLKPLALVFSQAPKMGNEELILAGIFTADELAHSPRTPNEWDVKRVSMEGVKSTYFQEDVFTHLYQPEECTPIQSRKVTVAIKERKFLEELHKVYVELTVYMDFSDDELLLYSESERMDLKSLIELLRANMYEVQEKLYEEFYQQVQDRFSGEKLKDYFG